MNSVLTVILVASVLVLPGVTSATDTSFSTVLSGGLKSSSGAILKGGSSLNSLLTQSNRLNSIHADKQPGYSVEKRITYRNRGNGIYTSGDGSILRDQGGGRLVNGSSGVRYQDHGNGRQSGSDGSRCRTNAGGSIECY